MASSSVGPLLSALAVLGLDLWTKAWIVREMPLYSTEEIIPGLFNLVHTQNKGIAFSLFADSGPLVREWILPILSAVAIAFVIGYFWRISKGAVWVRFALALILAGAAGNLYDRMMYGYVTDFLDFYVSDWHWPAFNVADSAITVGACALLLDSLRKPEEDAGAERTQAA